MSITSRVALRSFAALALALALPATAAEPTKHGKPLKGLSPTPLEQVLEKPVDGQEVRLEGVIKKVCLNKGCWLELASGDRAVHVTFEDYGFFVPKDSAGSQVVLEGKVKVSEPAPADVEHLQKEGAGAAAASKVSVVASGVEIAPPPSKSSQ